MTLILQGNNQEGGVMYWQFVGPNVLASGPQKGGWRCRWTRKELLELYGLPENATALQVANYMSRVWKLKVTIEGSNEHPTLILIPRPGQVWAPSSPLKGILTSHTRTTSTPGKAGG